MKLRFEEKAILHISKRYQYGRSEEIIIRCKQNIRKKGYLTKKQLLTIGQWKSPRSSGNIKKNSPEYVQEITQFAFKAHEERTRIEILTNLDGVQWPTASVILHLYHKDKYPILDYRALWSCSIEKPNKYSFSLWWKYVEFCRDIAKRNKVGMRVLDRALWQYSKENQKK